MAAGMSAEAAAEEAEVESLAHDGRGVARVAGKAVFVHGALPGERVRLQRGRRHRRHDEAVVADVLRAAPERVEPRCPHFGVCGGCSLQHLREDAQIVAKQRQVAAELARIGRVEPASWLPPLTGPTWAYRRRARLGCRWVTQKGRSLVGFRERAGFRIADIGRCEVLAEPAGALITPLSELLGGLSIRDRVPQVEVAIADEATALVLRVLAEPSPADLEAMRAFESRHRVELYLQPGGLDTVRPLSPPATPLSYALPGLPAGIAFEPTDFVQVNAVVNRKMVAQALELLAPEPGDAALDLFCGLGNFSLPLAGHVARVTGIEGDAALVARARDNAARNGIANAAFEVGDLARDPAGAGWAAGRYERVLLDPPRAGAREVLAAVAGCGARRIVYVSCHPGTLARDAGELVHAHGFRLLAAGVMDMFPHTSHVESIAVFEPGRA